MAHVFDAIRTFPALREDLRFQASQFGDYIDVAHEYQSTQDNTEDRIQIFSTRAFHEQDLLSVILQEVVLKAVGLSEIHLEWKADQGERLTDTLDELRDGFFSGAAAHKRPFTV
jgi:hypothetical protein